MKRYLIQAAILIIFSIFVGMVFNLLNPQKIPYMAKGLSTYSESSSYEEPIVETIDLEIAKKFFDEQVLFIDARDADSYAKAHISNAISSFPYNEMVDRIFELNGFDKPLVIYCDDDECGLSEDLAFQLQAEGFSKIYVFGGGWNQWKEGKLPIDK